MVNKIHETPKENGFIYGFCRMGCKMDKILNGSLTESDAVVDKIS